MVLFSYLTEGGAEAAIEGFAASELTTTADLLGDVLSGKA